MKRSRFTETQIISILKEADAGAKVKDVCRRHGISDATYYNWKSKYGGMEASDLKRLRETGHEVILLSYDQLEAFAGNMLELRTAKGERAVAMSERAYASLTDEQRERFEQNGRLIVSNIDTIENSAGGSVRCMLAEVHLNKVGE